MKKKLLIICMALSMAFSVTACGDSYDNDDEDTKPRKEREKDEENDDDDERKSDNDSFFSNLGLINEDNTSETEASNENIQENETESIEQEAETVEAISEINTQNVSSNTEETNSETSKKRGFDLKIQNPVFFDKDGIKMTFLGADYGSKKARIQLDNNNPDNKIIDFEFSGIRINNVGELDLLSRPKASSESPSYGSNCVSGTSFIYEIGLQYEDYDYFNSLLNVNSTNRVIYEYVFDFKIQIGSESEWEEHKIHVLTENYEENYMQTYISDCKKYSVLNASTDINSNVQVSDKIMYGVSASTFNLDASTSFTELNNFDVYHKELADEIAIVFDNNSDTDLDMYNCSKDIYVSVVANDTIYYRTKFTMYGNTVSSEGGKTVLRLDDTAMGLKKALEISDDSALSLIVSFSEDIYGDNIKHAYICPLQ